MPAITICYPEFISMQKYAKVFPEVEPVYRKYQNIINNVSEEDYNNETLKEYLYSLFTENFNYKKKQYEIPVYDAFEKLSIPFHFPFRPINQFNNSNIIQIIK